MSIPLGKIGCPLFFKIILRRSWLFPSCKLKLQILFHAGLRWQYNQLWSNEKLKQILFIFISKFTNQSFNHHFSLILPLGFKVCNLCLCTFVLSFQYSRFSVLGSVTTCFWEYGCSWMLALRIRLLAMPTTGWSFCLFLCANFIAFWI